MSGFAGHLSRAHRRKLTAADAARPNAEQHAAGRMTRILRANGILYRGINVLMLSSTAAAKRY
jgi:antirestriction protein ArdC